MVKLTHHWEGPPDHPDQKASKLLHRCRSVRASHCRPQRSEEGRTGKLQCRTPQGLKERCKKASPHQLTSMHLSSAVRRCSRPCGVSHRFRDHRLRKH